MNATDVMDAPEGTVRAGDEFHDPANWVRCDTCGHDSPDDLEECWYCGEDL